MKSELSEQLDPAIVLAHISKLILRAGEPKTNFWGASWPSCGLGLTRDEGPELLGLVTQHTGH